MIGYCDWRKSSSWYSTFGRGWSAAQSHVAHGGLSFRWHHTDGALSVHAQQPVQLQATPLSAILQHARATAVVRYHIIIIVTRMFLFDTNNQSCAPTLHGLLSPIKSAQDAVEMAVRLALLVGTTMCGR